MRLFARSAGKNQPVKSYLLVCLFIIFFSKHAHAIHNEIYAGNYTQPTLIYLTATTAFYYISQFEEGTLVFSGLYGMGAMYLMREVYSESENYEDFIIPSAMLTMSVLNAALFSDDDQFTDHEVFLYNWVAATAIAAYGVWEHSKKKDRRQHEAKSEFIIWPTVFEKKLGLVAEYNF